MSIQSKIFLKLEDNSQKVNPSTFLRLSGLKAGAWGRRTPQIDPEEGAPIDRDSIIK